MSSNDKARSAHHKAVYLTLAMLTGAGLFLDAKIASEVLKLVCYVMLAR